MVPKGIPVEIEDEEEKLLIIIFKRIKLKKKLKYLIFTLLNSMGIPF